MAWFRKEKKPRKPRAERLEIPADVWEKCESCGHTDIREKFDAQGFDPYIMTTEQFGALIKADLGKYAKVIKAANIKAD